MRVAPAGEGQYRGSCAPSVCQRSQLYVLIGTPRPACSFGGLDWHGRRAVVGWLPLSSGEGGSIRFLVTGSWVPPVVKQPSGIRLRVRSVAAQAYMCEPWVAALAESRGRAHERLSWLLRVVIPGVASPRYVSSMC